MVAAAATADPGPMLTSKTLGSVLFCAFVGFWLGRAVFVWILDVDRTWEIVAMAGFGAVGLLVGVASVIEERQKGR